MRHVWNHNNQREGMINIQNKVDCCGCNACGDICSNKAITFKTDNEGFWYPEVDIKKCVNCGLCEKVCPIININIIKNNNPLGSPLCFAAQNKNLEALFNSTSGSAFSALAEKMYKQGGYVGGAIFNDDFSVKQFISNNKGDLDLLRNTKYVQSNSEGFYLRVRELLKSGEKVLVCGLPCQMAGLHAFLMKDYENLIIIDLLCLGINSPKILPAYLKYKEEKHGSKIVYYKAKNKELGWRQLTTKIVFENGDVEYDERDTNYFTQGFISTHAFARPSCYECRFKGMPRIADISLGDFWGAEKHIGSEYDNDLGTSIIFLNTEKGKHYFDGVSHSFRIKQVSVEMVLPGNRAIMNSLSKPAIDRDVFYKDLDNLPFKEFADRYINLPGSTPVTLREKLKNIARFCLYSTKASGCNIKTWYQNIYYNLFCRQFDTRITDGRFIILQKYCVLDVSKKCKINIGGIVQFGLKRIRGSKLESRLLAESGSTLSIQGGKINYGADIEVFKNAKLEIGRNVIFNINSTIICGDHIVVGDNVCFGRNVTVRDNNGNHFLSRRVFKNKRPVTIGQHSWITEQSIVMPGARIGVGVIVGAGSIVSGKLPNFTLATGRPAVVVDEDIFWKA